MPTAVEEALAAAQREVAGLHRLAMMGTMAAMVAHEINNLATPVLARAQDALKRDDVPAMRKALERTIINTNKSIAIAQHLLGLARAREAALEPVEVAAAVTEALDMLPRPLEKDGIELRLDVPAGLRVRAEKTLLEQVLLNLVLNARQALREKNGVLAIAARRDNGTIVISVRDTGCGIAERDIDAVFNPFLARPALENPREWQPVGLGLTACRTLAHQHGATLHVSANQGPGCTFELRWPAA